MTLKYRKVTVLGLDGVPPHFLGLIVEFNENKLRFLRDIVSTYGIHKLASTVPYISPAAWTSMFTGVYPLKHTIFDFVKLTRINTEIKLKFTSITDVKSKFLWEYLPSNLKTILINIPSFSPAVRINGIMISGPPRVNLSTYPSHLSRLLKKRFNYKVDIEDFNLNFIQNKHETLKHIQEIEANRIRTIKYLAETYNKWSLLIAGFLCTDNILHFSMYKIMEYINGNITDEPVEHKVLLDVLKNIDNLAEFLYKKSSTLIMVSDHGMKCYESLFLVNSWLISKNYLSLATKGIVESNKLISTSAFKLSYKLVSRIPKIKKTLAKMLPKVSVDRFSLEKIDFKASKLFAYSTNMPVSLIKTIGSTDTEHYVENLNKELKNEYGSTLSAYSIHDISNRFYGIRLNRFAEDPPDFLEIPDIIIISDDRYVCSSYMLNRKIVVDLKRPCDHDIVGFLTYASRDNDVELDINNAKIVDITPTIIDIITNKRLKIFDGKSLKR